MTKRDYYEVLNVNPDADQAAIKKAYRGKALEYHPDRNPNDESASDLMKEVNEAYAVLNDTEKRQLYDAYGHSGLSGFSQQDIFSGTNFSSLFSEFGLGDLINGGMFGSIFGDSQTRSRESRRGADLRYDLTMTLEEAARGGDRTITLPDGQRCGSCNGEGAEPGGTEECDQCHGSGRMIKEQRSGISIVRQITTCPKCGGRGRSIREVCKTCKGQGELRGEKTIPITVPAGVATGHSLKLRGEGEGGERASGDLYVVFNVEEHDVFKRQDDDIYVEAKVDLATAALGGELQVPGLDGDLEIHIPAGTQNDDVLTVPGRGMPRLDSRRRGDEHVLIKIVIPTSLSHKERKLLEEFRQLRRGTDSSIRP